MVLDCIKNGICEQKQKREKIESVCRLKEAAEALRPQDDAPQDNAPPSMNARLVYQSVVLPSVGDTFSN
jgi:hypothetical protein